MSSLNHILKFGTTALAALVLSACGSSSGDSNNNEATPTNNETQQNSTGSPINSNETQQTQKTETGAALVISGSNNNFTSQRIAIDNYNTTSINVDGTITVLGVRGTDKLLEAEAKRIIEKLPKLIPGKQRGKPTPVTFAYPINFKLQS